jgi:5-methylcytosine-specific restriction endonuclease McrBC GTP-binding regulatory subunit McrB
MVVALAEELVPDDYIQLRCEPGGEHGQTVSITRAEKERRKVTELVRRLEFVSVRPDWLDGKEVVGFYNVLSEEYVSRPFLNLLLRAHRDPGKPHFVILDEMNLARVEHYFADLLSATESRTVRNAKVAQEPLHLHEAPQCLPLGAPDDWQRPSACVGCKASLAEVDACKLHFDGVQMVPPKLGVPMNVFVTGTVNVDETTHAFSPKVLDRANVIEFNRVDLGESVAAEDTPFVLNDATADFAATVARKEHFDRSEDRVKEMLRALNNLLARHNLHFGYRVANEIALYIENAKRHVGDHAVQTALDLQVLQKVLPKLHGSKQRLQTPLSELLVFAVLGREDANASVDDLLAGLRSPRGSAIASVNEPKLPRAAQKISRMLDVLRTQGFVSFIE